MTRALRNLMFSAIFAAALLGGAELILRILGIPDPGIYAGDPGSLWWLRPDLPPRALPFPEGGTEFTVRTNRLGYRGPDPAQRAWICLGDSTTFGWGVEVEDAFPAQLEAELLRRGHKVEVLNAGVPGQHPPTMGSWLKAIAPRYGVSGVVFSRRVAFNGPPPTTAARRAARPTFA